MTGSTLADLIAKLPVFKVFSRSVQEQIASMDNNFLRFHANEPIVREMSRERDFFILIRGSARVTRNKKPDQIIATLRPGAIIGEMAFLSGATRSSNVICNENGVVVMRVTELSLAQMSPEVREQIKDSLIELLVERVNEMNDRLLRLASK
ncbi:MAG: cyclic nucleotide-binding domain-containing protein [Magnetococcales bacterium]|nr:cyclic nucleotide-binding domain-containing protein [Magnetococcales bacterium]